MPDDADSKPQGWWSWLGGEFAGVAREFNPATKHASAEGWAHLYESGSAALPENLRRTEIPEALRRAGPEPPQPQTAGEWVGYVGGEAFGGAIPGAIQWAGGVPVAALSGIATARERAKAEHREPTYWEEFRDAAAEMVGRKFTGWIFNQPFTHAENLGQRVQGRLTAGLEAAGVGGAQSFAEGVPWNQQSLTAATNFALGFVAPSFPESRENFRAAKEAAARGDVGEAEARFSKAMEDPRVAEAMMLAARTDTGINFPEKPETLKAQQDQLLLGMGQVPPPLPGPGDRVAVMYPKGTPPAAPPPGTQRVVLPRGTFDYDPARVDEQTIRMKSAAGRENELLGLGPYSKDDVDQRIASGEKPVVVTERAIDGTEIKSALGTDQTAAHQKSVLEASKSPGSTIQVESMDDVYRGRTQHLPTARTDVEAAERAKPLIQQMLTSRDHHTAISEGILEPAEQLNVNMPDMQRVDILSDHMNGRPVPPEYQRFFDTVDDLYRDYWHKELDDDIEYEFRDNYWGIQYTPESLEAYLAKRGVASPGAGAGGLGFTKEKAFDDPKAALAQGLVQKSTNWAVGAQLNMAGREWARARKKLMGDFVDAGVAVPFTPSEWPGGQRPAQYKDWDEINVARKEYLIHGKAKKLMDYGLGAQKEAVTKFLEDVTGQKQGGLSKAGEAWSLFRNTKIPIDLALSAFHPVHIADIAFKNYMATMLSLKGFDREAMMKGLSEYRPTKEWAYGQRASEFWKTPREQLTEPDRINQDLLIAMGYTPGAPSWFDVKGAQRWRRFWNDEVQTITDEWKNGGYQSFAAKMKIPPTLARGVGLWFMKGLDSLKNPVFTDWIPNTKVAAALKQAKTEILRHPEWWETRPTPERTQEMRSALSRIREDADNRFGQMQYNKELWYPVLRKLATNMFLSWGWNIGNIRQIYGVSQYVKSKAGEFRVNGSPQLANQIIASKEFTNRALFEGLYWAGAMMTGGLMSYAMSGVFPSDWKDFFYPRTDPNDPTQRNNTPFFSRDASALHMHVMANGGWMSMAGLPVAVGGGAYLATGNPAWLGLAAASPAGWEWIKGKLYFGGIDDVIRNQDYYGNQVWDPYGSMWTIAGQMLGHVINPTPISMQAMERGNIVEPAQQALAFGGFNTAPGYATQSPALQTIYTMARQDSHRSEPLGEQPRINAQREMRQAFRIAIKSGKPEDWQAYTKLRTQYDVDYHKYVNKVGRHGRRINVRAYQERSWKAPPGLNQFKELSPDQQRTVMGKADPDERAIYSFGVKSEIRDEFPEPDPGDMQKFSPSTQMQILLAAPKSVVYRYRAKASPSVSQYFDRVIREIAAETD